MFNDGKTLLMLSDVFPIYGNITVAAGLSTSCDGLGNFG